MDFNQYDREPVFKTITEIQSINASLNLFYKVASYVRLNTYNTTDDYI